MREGALDVSGDELLTLFVVEGVTHPSAFGKPTADKYAKASMILRENLCLGRVGQELSLVELSEHPFSEGFLDCFEVYLPPAVNKRYARFLTSRSIAAPVSIRAESRS